MATHGRPYAALKLRCPCPECVPVAERQQQLENARRSGFGGVTVTLRDLHSGEAFTVTANGDSVEQSLALIVDSLDGERWRVLSCSTVRSILADLKGTRSPLAGPMVRAPESALLGLVGRTDLIGAAV